MTIEYKILIVCAVVMVGIVIYCLPAYLEAKKAEKRTKFFKGEVYK